MTLSSDLSGLNVASYVWSLPSELHQLQGSAAEELGCRHGFFFPGAPIPEGTDAVLVQGPYGTLLPLARQLGEMDPSHRPALAYWFQQSLEMRGPAWLRGLLSLAFSELHGSLPDGGRRASSVGAAVRRLLHLRGSRLGFVGDILWLHRRGLLDLLALSSTVYADYFSWLGVPSIVVPRGYHPNYGRDLGLERNVAVVWMGKLRTGRRSNSVHWLRDQLAARGLAMQLYDGVENGFIFGERRTQVLNRTRFVLNVFFSGPTDELSIRYFVAAANGAVVLTEPGVNRYPFVSGTHFVECPVERMPEMVEYYVQHPEEWRRMSAEMLALISRDLTLERSVAAIIEAATRVREQARSGSKASGAELVRTQHSLDADCR